MLTNSENSENLFGSNTFDSRSGSCILKNQEGRNRSKTIIGGIIPVDRQDSLMLCQQLQEQDGFDFMDQSMDLTPYLTGLRGIDDGSEDLDPVIDKQRTLQCDIQLQQANCGSASHYANLMAIGEVMKSDPRMDDTLVVVPETSSFAASCRSLKEETSGCEETRGTREVHPIISVKKEAEQVEITFTPTIKPRKYSLKPEAEKKSPLYRLKREKNNDAVRRSRTKAKQQQKMKDEQIKQLQSQVTEFGEILNNKNDQIGKLESALREVKEGNRNLHAENVRIKNELDQAKKRCRCSAHTA